MDQTSNWKDNKALQSIIRLCSIPDIPYAGGKCSMCDKSYDDIVVHVITQCPQLYQERNVLWDNIIDNMDVTSSVIISSLSDEQFVDWICNGSGNNPNTKLMTVKNAQIIHNLFMKGFTDNFNWIR